MKKVKGIGQWAGKDVPGMYQAGGEIKKKKSDKEAWKDYVKNNPGKGKKTTPVPGAKDFKPNAKPKDTTLKVRDEYKNFPSDSEIKKKTKKKGRLGAKTDRMYRPGRDG